MRFLAQEDADVVTVTFADADVAEVVLDLVPDVRFAALNARTYSLPRADWARVMAALEGGAS